MGVPGGPRVDPEPKGMILRQTHVIGAPLVHEGENAAWRRIPRVPWNHIESGLQPCLQRVAHRRRGGRRKIRKWRSRFLTHGARLVLVLATTLLARASFAQLASGERK